MLLGYRLFEHVVVAGTCSERSSCRVTVEDRPTQLRDHPTACALPNTLEYVWEDADLSSTSRQPENLMEPDLGPEYHDRSNLHSIAPVLSPATALAVLTSPSNASRLPPVAEVKFQSADEHRRLIENFIRKICIAGSSVESRAP